MRYRVGRFTLNRKEREAVAKDKDLRTGCSVPESGIYRALHSQHPLPKAVTLIRNQCFPRCSKCAEPVFFELERPAPAVGGSHGFNVMLYELPEIAEQQEDESLTG